MTPQTTDKPAAWTHYHDALHLARRGAELSPALMAALCPHLTPKEAIAAFAGGDGEEERVICPPLRVRGAFNVIRHQKPRDGKPGVVSRITAGRTLRPQATEEGRRSDAPSLRHQADAAVAFAERAWGGHLITDTWMAYLEIYLQDPSTLRAPPGLTSDDATGPKGYPITKGRLHIALALDMADIANDDTKPGSACIDDAVIDATVDDLIGAELKGNRGGYTRYHCILCANPLGLTGCKGCRLTFGDDGWRCSSLEPLGPKLVAVVRASGLTTFPKDPAEALAHEHAQWTLRRREAAARKAARTAR